LIKRSFQGLSVAIETVRIIEELMEIWPNEVCDSLVDSLNTYGDLKMQGQCKDYIYSKHSACPYSKNHFREKDVLERIYIDIWGPTQTQSAGGAQYFMLMIDGFSSFRTVAFLSSK